MYDDLKLEDWLRLQETANKDARSEPQLLGLLVLARSGDASAKDAMFKGALHLIFAPGFEWVQRSSKRRLGHIITDLYLNIATSIDRLIANDRDDVVKYLTDQLPRAMKAYYREQSPNIYQPASTKSSRKKKGLAPHVNLTRVGGCITNAALRYDEFDVCNSTYLSDGAAYLGPMTTQSGQMVRVPSKYRGYDEGIELVDLLDEFTEEQQEIVPHLVEGVPLCQIADETSMSLYAARQLKTQIRTHYGASQHPLESLITLATGQDVESQARCELAVNGRAIVGPNGLELALPA